MDICRGVSTKPIVIECTKAAETGENGSDESGVGIAGGVSHCSADSSSGEARTLEQASDCTLNEAANQPANIPLNLQMTKIGCSGVALPYRSSSDASGWKSFSRTSRAGFSLPYVSRSAPGVLDVLDIRLDPETDLEGGETDESNAGWTSIWTGPGRSSNRILQRIFLYLSVAFIASALILRFEGNSSNSTMEDDGDNPADTALPFGTDQPHMQGLSPVGTNRLPSQEARPGSAASEGSDVAASSAIAEEASGTSKGVGDHVGAPVQDPEAESQNAEHRSGESK